MPSRDLNHDIRLLTRAARAGVITLQEAVHVLGLEPRPATIRMAGLTARGGLRRIRRGVFLVIPPKTPVPQEETARDEGALAEALFGPCFFGGWSAAAQWHLDRGNRRAILIVTAARVRRTSVRAEGHRFHLVHAPLGRIHGPDVLRPRPWSAPVSGPARTIVDALCRPGWLGGAVYLADALVTYRQSAHWDEEQFAEVLRVVGTGAAHRRLGFLMVAKRIEAGDLFQQAVAGRTAGVVDLDPGSPPEGPIDSFWGVRRNVNLEGWDLPEDDDVEDDFIEGVDDPDP